MELTITYILSQVFIIINYVLLIATYQVKNRKTVLTFNCISMIAEGLSYLFLSAWTGLAMIMVATIRNIIFIMDEKRIGKSDKITKKDIIILLVLYFIAIILAIYTYEGFWSLMSVFATMLYTYSIWQKKTSVYKKLGIPVGLIWIIYNIYIFSIWGIILEAVLLISAIIGIVREKKRITTKNLNEIVALNI